MSDDAINLVEPDPAWPTRFAAEVERIRNLLGEAGKAVRFEHVGSTAVAGLVAKPVIDILVIPPDGQWPRDLFERLMPSAGYVFWAENPDPQHLFFVKGMPPLGAARTHHVHVRPAENAAPILAFRDYLRLHTDAAEAYMRLKQNLAAAHRNDRDAYTRGKDHFVAEILQRAARATA